MRAGARTVRSGEATVRVQYIASSARFDPLTHAKGRHMNSIVYIVGAIVIVLFILSFLGLR